MTDWLRFIGMIFYAPLRGISEVRDRGGLLPAFFCAYLSQLLYLFAVQWLSGDRAFLTRPSVIFANLFHAATALLPFAIVLVPLIALVAGSCANSCPVDGSTAMKLVTDPAPRRC